MTDKKKLDEAATLTVSCENNGMTSNTTFSADDATALAELLKNAGIAGNSAIFNGPATLTLDVEEKGGTMSSTINAPDLRSIMHLLEPEFAEVGDIDTSDLPAEMDDDDIVDPVIEPEVAVEPEAELEVVPAEVDMGMDLEGPADEMEFSIGDEEIGEEADYDFRTHDAHPEEYAGVSDKKIVQPETNTVPARSGDNPIKGFKDYFKEASDRNFVEPPKPVTMESLLDEFTKTVSPEQKAKLHAQLRDYHRANGREDIAKKHDDVLAGELDEAGRQDWQAAQKKYGEPYYLNTDCGYASLESIMASEGFFDNMEMGLAQHSTKTGFTILEIDRNGKKGYNFVNSPDGRLQPGTPVSCITQTSNGQKIRPGKFIASFTAQELSTNYEGVVAELAKLGITPNKKLPVKTFD